MKKAQFLGWFRKAYPEIACKKTTNFWGNEIYKIGTNCEIAINDDNSIVFYTSSGDVHTADADIVMKCRSLFGEPNVVFQYPGDKSQLKTNKEREIKDIEPEKPVVKEQPKKKESVNYYNRDIILNTLKERFGDRLKTVSKYLKTEVFVDEISGPILGDQGLSPSSKERYKFILYSDKEEITKVLTNFFNQLT